MVKLKHGRHSSAKKEERKSERRNKLNKILYKKIDVLTRKLKKEINNKNITNAKTILNELYSYYDKSVKRRIFHQNKANREKSKLSRLLNKISQQNN